MAVVTNTPTDVAAIQNLAASMRGKLIQPDDPAHDTARKVYNAMIDRRPALIARCADAGDVILALKDARDRNILVAVRGGGHNGAGLGVCGGGLVIVLSLMKRVRVDPG